MKKVIDFARNKSTNAGLIKSRLGISVLRRTITRYLSGPGGLRYRKMAKKPHLTAEHKKRRFDFAVEHVDWAEEWSKVIFSDEKKFNLDGPDGWRYYWHDLSQDEVRFSTNLNSGAGIMVWAGFCSKAKTAICVITTTMNSVSYVTMLRRNLIPFADQNFPDGYVFQQDNAPCHRARNTTEWFETKGITVMEWPACSPDLNPIENLWGILARGVYANARQFNNINTLKLAIIEAWDLINVDILENLVGSMHKRMVDVIKVSGDSIKY